MNSLRTQSIADHFSNRANIYDVFGIWVNNETILASMTSYIPEPMNGGPMSIVDLGAGTGAVSKYILENYPFETSITAIDICADMLNKISNPNVNLCVASLESLPFENNTFDVAVSRQCLHYVEQIGQAIKEIRRVVKKNGIFILSQIVPRDNQTKEYWSKIISFRQPLRKQYYSEDDWTSLFASNWFNLLSIERFSHRGSVNKWVNKYKICDVSLINEHKRLLLEAPVKFIEKYNISQIDNDVQYDSFWFVAKFRCVQV